MHSSGASRRGARTHVCCLTICIIHEVVPAIAGTHTPCPIILGAEAEAFCPNERRWLWVPAFAGTTKESGSLPVIRLKIRFLIHTTKSRSSCRQDRGNTPSAACRGR